MEYDSVFCTKGLGICFLSKFYFGVKFFLSNIATWHHFRLLWSYYITGKLQSQICILLLEYFHKIENIDGLDTQWNSFGQMKNDKTF